MEVIRSFDPNQMQTAMKDFSKGVDCEDWLANHLNIMYVSGDDVGLATYEYPGCYNAHWFFKSRGKAALDTAFAMYDVLFNQDGAKVVRGITPVHLKGARYLAKRIGFISLGIETYPDGEECEIMCLTKDAFNERQEQRNNG